MKTVKAKVDIAVRGELRRGGEVIAFNLEPGTHDIDPAVFRRLEKLGVATKAAATKRKETRHE